MTIKTMRNKLLILIFFAALYAPSLLRGQAVILKADSMVVPCHAVDTFLIPVRVFNFNDVAGLQFTFAWNPAHLDYAYITDINPAMSGIGFDTTSFTSSGKFTFSWTTIGGLSLPDTSILFKVAFARIGGPATLMEFTDDPTAIAAIDPMGNDLMVETVPGQVEPIDMEPPSVVCPDPVTVEVFGPSPVNNIAPASILDNCSVESIGWSSVGATMGNFPNDPDASGSVFNLGQSTVTYEVSDVGGNTASCTFTVDLVLAPSDSLTIIASDANASCGQTVTIEITALNFDSISGLQFSLGWDTTVLQYDTVGNFNPSLLLNNANFGTNFAGDGFLGFAWTSGLPNGTTLADGSVLFSISFNVVASNNSSTALEFGAFPTDLVAFSSAMLPPEEIGFITVNGLVTIVDTEPPVIECPADVSVMAPIGSTTATVNGLDPLTLTDNCDPDVSLSYVQSGSTNGQGNGPANGVYNAGTTTVVYTGTDNAGNTSTCSFTVLVDAGTPLTLELDTVATDCQASGGQVAVTLSVQDFVDIIGLQFNVEWDTSVLVFDSIGNQYPGLNLSPTMFFGYASVSNGLLQFFGGNAGGWPNIPDGEAFFTIYFTVQNANGTSNIDFSGTIDAVNSAFNSIPVVTINGFFQSTDLTPPMVTCPMDTLVMAFGNECNANVTIDTAQAVDACSGIMSITPDKADDVYESGVTVVTYTAVDMAGNSATCSFSVTVEDNLPPQLSNCPTDTIVDAAGCSAKVSWPPPTAFDQCTDSTPSLVFSDSSGTVFPVGDSTVVIVAIDVFGDSSICSFTVTVRDTVSPTLVCLDDFQVVALDSCSVEVDYAIPLAFDNCDQNVEVDGGPLPGTVFPAGSTVVTYTATDDYGNTTTCSFMITVVDLNPPVLDTCPPDLTIMALQDTCGAFPTWTPPAVSDDCTPDVALMASNGPGSYFPVGTATVVYEAQDAGGNTSTCSFSVTVTEDVPPVISNCPVGFVFEMPPDQCDTMVTWTPPTATDNCALDTLIGSDVPGTVFGTGTHTVTYTAYDDSGNTASCAFVVAVNDNVAPVFTSCPADITVQDASPCGEVVSWIYPTATDNCLLDTITSTRQPTDLITAQITNVLVLAIDASGNQDTCAFTITLDVVVVPPAFDDFPADVSINGCPQAVTWTPPIAGAGFCDPPIITSIPDNIIPGDTFPVGTTNIIYLALDSTGVELLRDTFTVTIIEDTPPAIACPSDEVSVHVGGVVVSDPGAFVTGISAVASCDSVALDFGLPLATDDCGDPTVEQTTGVFAGNMFTADSVHVLTFVATDAAGNTASCVVQVEVIGLQPLMPVVDPPIACPGDQVILMVDSFPDATYTWTGPNQTYPDNSMIIVIASAANAGTYTVFADINGCITPLDSAEVVLSSNPVANDDVDFMVDPGMPLDSINVLINDIFSPPSDFMVTYDTLPAGVTYLGNGLFSFAGAEDPGTISFFYEICSVTCPDFCDMATVTIRVRQNDCSVIPNIITPNGDGVNDYFTIPCLESGLFRDNTLVIYNQWGDRVFDAVGYDNNPLSAWNGTLNGEQGKDLPDGVYFYIFKAGPNEPAQKGFIEIYR
ncbi:MAG: HYR domain-containing protein [Bacteroidetes bacterium]|nr:MAG: HYR domain-containing protein [Bacteroidota bacterium]